MVCSLYLSVLSGFAGHSSCTMPAREITDPTAGDVDEYNRYRRQKYHARIIVVFKLTPAVCSETALSKMRTSRTSGEAASLIYQPQYRLRSCDPALHLLNMVDAKTTTASARLRRTQHRILICWLLHEPKIAPSSHLGLVPLRQEMTMCPGDMCQL